MNADAADSLDVKTEQQNLISTIEKILSEAKIKGATQSSVAVSKVIGLSTTVRNQDIETLEFNQDCGFGITVYIGKQKGNASTSDTSIDSIKRTVQAAVDIAKQTGEDPYSGLADEALMASDIMDLDLDHPMGITADRGQQIALQSESALLDAGAESDGSSFSSHRSIHAYGNSHGFIASHASSRHSHSAVAIAKDDAGMQRDYYYSVSRQAKDLDDAQYIGARAAEKSQQRLGAKPISTGQYPILLNPDIAVGFLGHIMAAIKGAKLYRKSSFLLDSLEQKLMPDFVNIYERPHIKGALASRCYDAEGVATRNQNFFTNGVLKSYILSSYSGRRLDMQTTGNAGGVHNLHISDTGQDQEQLIQEMGTGLIITEVMGQGVNIVTGDYSRGASGFWVENGEIIHPVDGITIAGNLKQMMANIVAIGTDRPSYLSTRSGSILLSPMTVAAS